MEGGMDLRRFDALVAADEVGQLVIVVVAEAASEGFDVAAVFVVEQVDEVAVAFLHLVVAHLADAARIDEAHGRPFVPARKEDEFGIEIHRLFELFGEAQALARTLLVGSRLYAVVIAPAHLFHRAVVGDGVGGRRDGHHFGLVGTLVPSVFLGIDVGPRAAVLAVAEPVPSRAEPRVAHGEEVGHFGRDAFGRAEDQRFVFPAEPQILVEPFAVEILEEVFQRALGVGVEDERELRRAVALGPHRLVYPADLQHDRQVDGLIGHVEHDHVHAGVREHLGVLADDPFVVGRVVAQIGLAPVVHGVYRSVVRVRRIGVDEFLVVVGAQRVGRRGDHDAAVGRRARFVVAVCAVPDDEEHPHGLVFARGAVLVVGSDFTAQRVLRRPCGRLCLRCGVVRCGERSEAEGRQQKSDRFHVLFFGVK